MISKLKLAQMMSDDICNSYLSIEDSNRDEVIQALEGLGYVYEDVVACLPLAIEDCLARDRPHVVYQSSTTNSISIFIRPCLNPFGVQVERDPIEQDDLEF
ncbi:MAG: hypothetical protein H0V72_18225 [Bradyrhizobium sp.]|nr:hypothetical protein [Bradyrhizobium sp.]